MVNINTTLIVFIAVLTEGTSLDFNMFHKDETLLDVLCPTEEASLEFGSSRTVQECANKCHLDTNCGGFFYSKQQKDCKGVPGILSANVTCNNTVGFAYYRKTALKQCYGAQCNSTVECTMNASLCNQGVCSCKAGYSYNYSTGACVTECDSYGSTYTKHEHKVLSETYIVLVEPVSFEYCKSVCSNKTVCRGFNYNGGAERCKTLAITPLTHPNTYYNTPSIDYYQRNCSE